MFSSWPKSESLMERSRKVVSSTRPDLDGTFPFVVASGLGGYVTDLEGNRYLDLTASTGAVLLGHRHPEVSAATIAAINDVGSMFPTTTSPLLFEVAERLTNMFPSAERALFFRTGSEATTAAIRLARMATGRRTVLTSGYHGWHDWHLQMFPQFRMEDPTHIDFAYNLNLLELLLDRYAGDVACVIVTPDLNFFPHEYFAELRELTSRKGVILIFDEVVTGFRYGMGGFQSSSGITPEMTTLSKGLANGHAISAVVGRAELIEQRDKTHMWGTFNSEVTPLAAAVATLDVFVRDNVPAVLDHVGTALMEGLGALFRSAGVRADAFRVGSDFHIVFEDEDLGQAFYWSCLCRGVLFHRFDRQIVTAAHTLEDVQFALDVAGEALAELEASTPAAFQGWSEPSPEARDLRCLNETGGLMDYRRAVDEIPDMWTLVNQIKELPPSP
ncbi:aminotransferase class III-fold pyridoxal phosphate-dependent enzyme [Streptomyces capitiformicae]|uniref:Glutamate-1-semialdehyde 2,1-aminomutase n=1 Tax=Streptomyces capitiformicae TaxID=2014920 RepID=A0A919L608_9ACTN|nr:aminotransferase class III-fold pyridoxal phosphate-dependent enzyme [Streptomyces capitiformicae]GHH84729.1 glutamate-1-semialdehyde 2,1-aminomutase [Streptomyces capitiformicae]